MNNIKLIACDLDGTLLDSNKNVSQDNQDTIKSLKECKFVISTGRPLAGITYLNEMLDLNKDDCYSICYNGAVIINNKTKKIISSCTIPYSYIIEVFEFAKKYNLNFHAFKDDGTLLTNEKNEYTAVEEKINKIEAKVIDFYSINQNTKFIKCMIVSSKENLDKVINIVPNSLSNKMNVSRSSNIFLEFQSFDSNKGLGIKKLAKHLNIDIKDTMAIGDQDNDRSMFEVAGISVLMENGNMDLKEYVDFITTSNDSSGVANAIRHFNVK